MRKSVLSIFVLVLAVCVAPCCAQTASIQQPEEKKVAVFGQTIHYWDVGSGPVVVLVHGLGSNKTLDWGRVVAPLSKNYRILALDQIGFGQSDKPMIDYTIQTYVDFLNEFLHQLKIAKSSLMGESLGGWISAKYAAQASSDVQMVPVEKLVLVDAAGLKQDRPIPDLNPSSLASERNLLKMVFYETSWVTDEVVRKALEDRMRANISYTVHSVLSNPGLSGEMLDGKLGDIRVPTLVVWGKQDALLPVESGERYAAQITGAKLVTFDKCGHVPPVEKTEEFVAAVTAFLVNRGGAPAQ